MVTVTTAWDGGHHAESSLLRAEMNAALHSAAHVESLTIDHASGVVDVKVRLPGELTVWERDRRRAEVRATLETVVTGAFADEGLHLRRIVAH